MWPLVGRDRELEALSDRLKQEGSIVLAGPAGVGKTRLATELLQGAVARGFAVVRVAATQASAGMPFGAFATLLPELRPGLDRVQMLQRVAKAVVARGEGRPFILLVDDAHLLDDASAALTHHLAATGGAAVLATVRSTERAPDPVLALWKDGLAERVELAPLTESDVDDLLNAALGGPVDRATRQLVFERSSGNVLFLRELILGALDAGVLRQRVGVWRLEGRLPASARLVELVEARLGDLSDRDRDSLELLALGQPLGVDLFEQLTGVRTLPALERRHLVSVEKDGQRLHVGLAHPLYGDVLQRVLSPVRARALYRTLADALEATAARRRDDVLRLAIWRLEGGGLVQPGTLLAGGRRAWVLHDLPATERLARAAVAAGGGFDAGLLLGQVLSAAGRPEEAEDQLRTLVPEAADDRQRVELASARIDNLCYSMNRLEEGLAVAEAAEAAISDGACRDEITAHRASLLDASGDTTGGLALALPLLERADGRGLAWASVIATGALARTGATDAALATAERGLAAAARLTGPPLPWGRSAYAATQTWALLFSGRLSEGERLARTEYDRGVAEGSSETEFVMGAILAMVNVAQGRVATAARRAREAATMARDHGRPIHVRLALMSLVEALALAGRAPEAAEALAELDHCCLPVAHILEPEAAVGRSLGGGGRRGPDPGQGGPRPGGGDGRPGRRPGLRERGVARPRPPGGTGASPGPPRGAGRADGRPAAGGPGRPRPRPGQPESHRVAGGCDRFRGHGVSPRRRRSRSRGGGVLEAGWQHAAGERGRPARPAPGRRVRGRPHPCTRHRHDRPGDAVGPGVGDRPPGGGRLLESRHRRPALPLLPHGGEQALQRLHEARDRPPGRAGRGAARHLTPVAGCVLAQRVRREGTSGSAGVEQLAVHVGVSGQDSQEDHAVGSHLDHLGDAGIHMSQVRCAMSPLSRPGTVATTRFNAGPGSPRVGRRPPLAG